MNILMVLLREKYRNMGPGSLINEVGRMTWSEDNVVQIEL